MRRYGERLPAYEGGDWRPWLDSLCVAVHRMNGSYGPGYWELTTRRDLPGELPPWKIDDGGLAGPP